VRIFLGITGASGARYAVRLLQALVQADCEVGVCASSAGIEVIGTEVYGDPRLASVEVLASVTEGAVSAVSVYDP
jgi:3-polyprenyl-4-hydroxybenzoate decarboxylase